MEKLEKNKIAPKLLLLFVVLPTPAYAYLDPGTGSMLVSLFIGIAASLYFTLKNVYYSLSQGVLSAFGLKLKRRGRLSIVFYSEGGQYWKTFQPVVSELIGRRTACTYFTQDRNDPGLTLHAPYYSGEFIGVGNRGYARMNYLEADICVMTTPGLDVLQIKRSKGVRHYVHLVHAPTDMATYKLFSFDYYDSVFISGPHQRRSLRLLEEQRGTRPKRICEVGCTYYDEMVKELRSSEAKSTDSSSTPTVLVAPTWGKNGLLRRFGEKILIPLAKGGFRVIVRPHPQSYLSERDMLKTLEKSLREYGNLTWSREPDGLLAMSQADILLSDLSGIVFDFAFLFFKPVITLQFPLEKRGAESNNLPYDPWELGVLHTIGRQISQSDIPKIDTIASGCLKRESHEETIRNVRDCSVYNFGKAAATAADRLLEIAESIESSSISPSPATHREKAAEKDIGSLR